MSTTQKETIKGFLGTKYKVTQGGDKNIETMQFGIYDKVAQKGIRTVAWEGNSRILKPYIEAKIAYKEALEQNPDKKISKKMSDFVTLEGKWNDDKTQFKVDNITVHEFNIKKEITVKLFEDKKSKQDKPYTHIFGVDSKAQKINLYVSDKSILNVDLKVDTKISFSGNGRISMYENKKGEIVTNLNISPNRVEKNLKTLEAKMKLSKVLRSLSDLVEKGDLKGAGMLLTKEKVTKTALTSYLKNGKTPELASKVKEIKTAKAKAKGIS